jgi:hypothetical protein
MLRTRLSTLVLIAALLVSSLALGGCRKDDTSKTKVILPAMNSSETSPLPTGDSTSPIQK